MRQELLTSTPLVVSEDTSLSLDLLLSLQQRENRDRLGCYFVEGFRFAHAALDATVPILGYAWCPELLRRHAGSGVLEQLKNRPSFRLNLNDFAKLSFGPEPQGLALIVRQSFLTIDRLKLGNSDTWLGIETIRTPGNLGTILRGLKAAGGSGVILLSNRGHTMDIYDPLVLRSSMGALVGMKVVRGSYRELSRWSYRSEIRVLGADAEGPLDYRKVKFRRPILIMVGDERDGLSPGQRATCDGLVRIPMSAGVDSLNVAMATTVLLFEAHSQKHPCADRKVSRYT